MKRLLMTILCILVIPFISNAIDTGILQTTMVNQANEKTSDIDDGDSNTEMQDENRDISGSDTESCSEATEWSSLVVDNEISPTCAGVTDESAYAHVEQNNYGVANIINIKTESNKKIIFEALFFNDSTESVDLVPVLFLVKTGNEPDKVDVISQEKCTAITVMTGESKHGEECIYELSDTLKKGNYALYVKAFNTKDITNEEFNINDQKVIQIFVESFEIGDSIIFDKVMDAEIMTQEEYAIGVKLEEEDNSVDENVVADINMFTDTKVLTMMISVVAVLALIILIGVMLKRSGIFRKILGICIFTILGMGIFGHECRAETVSVKLGVCAYQKGGCGRTDIKNVYVKRAGYYRMTSVVSDLGNRIRGKCFPWRDAHGVSRTERCCECQDKEHYTISAGGASQFFADPYTCECPRKYTVPSNTFKHKRYYFRKGVNRVIMRHAYYRSDRGVNSVGTEVTFTSETPDPVPVCIGYRPGPVTVCPGSTTRLSINTRWKQVDSCIGAGKCTYTASCTGGNPPPGANWCTNDEKIVTINTPWQKVDVCTSRKCEYIMPAECGSAHEGSYDKTSEIYDKSDGNPDKRCDVIGSTLVQNSWNPNLVSLAGEGGVAWTWKCERGLKEVKCKAYKKGKCIEVGDAMPPPYNKGAASEARNSACKVGLFNSVTLANTLSGPVLTWKCGTGKVQKNIGSFNQDGLKTHGDIVGVDHYTPQAAGIECKCSPEYEFTCVDIPLTTECQNNCGNNVMQYSVLVKKDKKCFPLENLTSTQTEKNDHPCPTKPIQCAACGANSAETGEGGIWHESH